MSPTRKIKREMERKLRLVLVRSFMVNQFC